MAVFERRDPIDLYAEPIITAAKQLYTTLNQQHELQACKVPIEARSLQYR